MKAMRYGWRSVVGAVLALVASVSVAQSSSADLSALGVTPGTLTPAFTPANGVYTVAVPDGTSTAEIAATAEGGGALVVIEGEIGFGALTKTVTLGALPYTVTIEVGAEDGSTFKDYTIEFTAAAGADASLASLSLSTGSLSPFFAPSTLQYQGVIPSSATEVTLTVATTDPSATVTMDGLAQTAKVYPSVGLPQTAVVVVTAADGVTTRTYEVDLAVVSNDASLQSLQFTPGVMTPAFQIGVLSYALAIAPSVEWVQVMAEPSSPAATVTVDGQPAAPFVLVNVPGPGPFTILVDVLAEDGITTSQTTVSVTKVASSNTALASVAVDGFNASPAVAPGITEYSYAVADGSTTATVAVVPADLDASVSIDGIAAVAPSFEAGITLGVLPRSVPIVVTAADGVTTGNYALVISEIPSNEAHLSALVPSSGDLAPAFGPFQLTYGLTLPAGVGSVSFTATPTDSQATVSVNGVPVGPGGVSAPVTVGYGTTPVFVDVLAEDGVATERYTVQVTRPGSTEARLSALSSSIPGLPASFDPETATYVGEAGGATEVRFTVQPIDADATVSVNGLPLVAGVASEPLPLSAGNNVFVFSVLATDGVSTRDYQVTVSRGIDPRVTLSSFVTSAPCCGGVTPGQTTFDVQAVQRDETVTVTASDPAATLTLNGLPMSQGVATVVDATVPGIWHTYPLVVTSADGLVAQTYSVRVYRPVSSNAYLASLTPSAGSLSPAFTPSEENYSIEVPSGTVLAWAAVAEDAGAVISGADPITVVSGVQWVFVQVQAENGVTTREYRVVVFGQVTPPTAIESLQVSSGVMTPAFEVEAFGYVNSYPGALPASVEVTVVMPAGVNVAVDGVPVSSGAPVTVPVTANQQVIRVVATSGSEPPRTYQVRLVANNTPPTVDGPSTVTVLEDQYSPGFLGLPVAYEIRDEGMLGGWQSLGVNSQSPVLIPNNGIQQSLNINGGFVDFAVGSASDDFGSGEVWVEVSDVHGAQTRHVLTVDVLPVNDAPTMTLAVPSVEWPWVTNLMGTPGEVTGLIGSYVAGPLNESGQQVSFEVEVLPLTLPAIVNDVVIDGAGHASFVYQGAAGAVDVRVRARDDGGTANAGSDASAWQVSRWQLGDLADLRVELVAVAGAGGAGSTRTYTVRVSNTGPDAVTHAPVQVSTVDGLTAVTWLCAGEGGGVCETAVGEAHVRVPVTLPVGGAVVLTIEGEIVAASVWAQLDVSAWAPAGVGVLSPADDSVSYVEPIAPEAVFRHGFE